jgi:hypothetical protein
MAADTAPLPARVEFIESTRRLSRVTEADVTVLLPWPVVKAFRRPRRTGEWTACTPEFVIPPDPNEACPVGTVPTGAGTPAAVGGGMDVDGLRSVHRFCLTIPSRLRQAVAQFPERHWDLLSWAARTGPAADELLESNPALAFAVACGADLCGPESRMRYRDSQFLQAYHGQRRVLARLGFPPTERARRILRKLRPRAVSVASLQQLRLSLGDADVTARLAHVSHINNGVLAMLQSRTITLIAPAVLERVGREDGDAAAGDASRKLAEAVRLWGLVRPTTPLPRFERFERVHDIYAQLREDAAALARARERGFPPPPVPGSDVIIPICTKAMLIEEGRLQKNCATDYETRIAKGDLAMYRVLSPQRCTLSLRWSRGTWAIDQLKAACNGAAAPATRRVVMEWLRGKPAVHLPIRGAATGLLAEAPPDAL